MEKTRSQYEKEKTMTLFKQVAIAVSTIIVIMLGAVMYINYVSAKKDMITSLYETTVNNISTLSSNLAQAGDEEAFLVTTIDSEFDSGYFRLIEYTSADEKFTYKQEDTDPIEGVPLWFVNFTNVEVQTVRADVTLGWEIVGEVNVAGDTTVVYNALYKMFIKLIYLFFIFVSLALITLSVLLHFVLKPLKRIQNQAEAILKNEFVIQEGEPYTTEFKDVVKGMNAMVKKVEDIFEKGNEAAQRNKELLYNDPITKLFNRRYLMLKLSDLIKQENKINGGTVLFVALSSEEAVIKAIGRQSVDDFFRELANGFTQICHECEENLIARVNSTEFTLMLPGCEANDANEIAQNINDKFTDLVTHHKLDANVVYIDMGIYRFKPSVSVGELLTRADNALAQAKASDTENIHLYEEKDDDNAMGKEQWRAIIEEAIQEKHFGLKFWPTVNAPTKETNHKVMTFIIDGGESKRYFYGDFIAPAINLGLVSKMYLVALKDLITKSHSEVDNTICSIRLSNEVLKDPSTFEELSLLFETHAKSINFKLSFEVSDSFAINNTQIVKSFVYLFKKYEFGFGINSFTGESNNFSYLKLLNPAFIKADKSFLLDQSNDSMSALQIVTDSLGIDIIATFVKDEEELNKLSAMHIHKVQGPITDRLISV